MARGGCARRSTSSSARRWPASRTASAAAACPPPLPLRPTLAGTLQLVALAIVVALGGCAVGIARCASRRLAEQRPVVRVTQRKGFELTELM